MAASTPNILAIPPHTPATIRSSRLRRSLRVVVSVLMTQESLVGGLLPSGNSPGRTLTFTLRV
jgi:hypothetical protein